MVIKIKHLIQLRIIEYIYKQAQIAVAQGTAIPEAMVAACRGFFCLFFHSSIYKSLRSNAGVHGFEDKTEYLVPGCMDLKKNKISCTGVHESEKKILLCVQLCSSGGGSGPERFF